MCALFPLFTQDIIEHFLSEKPSDDHSISNNHTFPLAVEAFLCVRVAHDAQSSIIMCAYCVTLRNYLSLSEFVVSLNNNKTESR